MSTPELISLGSWSLWPDVLVRSAGFPIDQALTTLTEDGPAPLPDDEPASDVAWAGRMAEYSRLLNVAFEQPVLRAAVTWINHEAWETGLSQLARTDVTVRNSRRRSRERLAVNYLQRLTLKNDSVGFYGPMAWARFDPTRPASDIKATDTLVEARFVHFEVWAMEELGRAIPTALKIADADAPRRSPMVRLRTRSVTDWAGTELPAVCADLVRRADGSLSRAALIRAVTAREHSHDVVLRGLQECLDQGWISGGLALSPSLHPEDQLLKIFSTHPHGSDLSQALGPFLHLRDRLAESATDADAVAGLLTEMRAAFTEITGSQARHSAGRMYAGREIVCLEARRGLDATFGRDALEAIAPLADLLDAVRWLLAEIADHVVPLLEELAGRSQHALDLRLLALQELAPRLDALVGEAVSRFQRRLSLALNQAGSDPGAFRDLVARHFPRRTLRWPEARWASPDILFTHGPDGWGAVLGEIHPVANTLDYQCVASILPDPGRLADLLDATTSQPRLLVIPRSGSRGAGFTARTLPAARRPDEPQLVLSQRNVAYDEERTVHGVDCPVRLRDGRHLIEVAGQEHEPISLISDWLRQVLLEHFDLAPAGAHPRVAVGPLTVVRERWYVPAAELVAFTEAESERDAVEALQHIARELRLPSLVYVKLPTETKPLPVLLSSPGSVLAFRHTVRQAMNRAGLDGITVVECLPTAEQAWLEVAGEKYTSEHRVVAYLRDPA